MNCSSPKFRRLGGGRIAGSAFVVLAALAGAGCEATTGPPQAVAKLTCGDSGGTTNECTLGLPQGGGFTVTLEAVSCTALGNTVRLTKPEQYARTLTSDGCAETPPKAWNIGGSLAPGSEVAIEVQSAKLVNLPSLRVTGDYPEWLIEFEDGGDTDFNDLVFRVQANPPA